MKINNSQKIKSSVMKLTDIEKLSNMISRVAEKENADEGNSYKRFITYKIDQFNDFEVEFKESDDFLSYLRENFKDIKAINISFYGDKEKISISCGNNYPSFSIETEDRGRLMEYSEDIRKIFSQPSWNGFVKSGWMQILSTLFIFFVIAFPTFIFTKPSSSRDVALLWFIIYVFSSIVVFPLQKYLVKIYPSLVIKYNNECSGRVFKKDIWKIISGLILIIFSAWVGKIIFK